jgi:hypothetical protein
MEDFETITRRINGGLNGFDDRLRYYDVALSALGDDGSFGFSNDGDFNDI